MKRMIGLAPTSIVQKHDEITFEFQSGTGKFYHDQDCCEDVSIDDVNGDWNDLIGVPMLIADERTNCGEDLEGGGTYTWTFYTFRSINGSVDVKWYGSSNGYYSERVSFEWKDK